MAAVIDLPRENRGAGLLLAHCAALSEREPARARLEAAVGPELARLLVLALCGCHGAGRRGSFSP